MGFISTGVTTQLTAYLTQKGRELLLNGTEEEQTISYFGLGDSDTNYFTEFNLIQGTVPDLTGSNADCILSLASNVGIKYNVLYNTTTVPVIPSTQVMFQRSDDNQYYSSLDCLVHLDRISRYQLYNSSGNLGNPNRLTINNILQSPLVNLYNQVAILINPSLNPTTTDFAPSDSMVFQLLFDSSIYTTINNSYLSGTNTINQSNGGKSPIELTFSSFNVSGNTFLNGAGNCSVGLYNREIGYLYRNDNNGNSWQFLDTSQFEGIMNYSFYTDGNNNLLNQYADFTIAAKIDAKDDTSGIITSFIYRGDQNLNNVSDAKLGGLTNEIKFANQYAKLFADDYPVMNLSRTPVNPSTPVISGLMQKEVSNLKDFVELSPIFNLISGTSEYRTSKLSFSVYPKNNNVNVNPAILNIVFKFDNDEVLDGDADYSHISDSGVTPFIEYDFAPTNGVFQNKAKTGVFSRDNCGTNYTGSLVTYVVSGGTYTGSTQTAADALATNDVNTNGQAYANAQGTCTIATQYVSAAYSQYVAKNNCPVGYNGSTVLVQYPAGQFTSTISVADANYQASQAAQTQANSVGTCTYVPVYTGATGGGGGGCLLAGQQIILNENGDLKNIEDFEIGDTVYTYHEITKKLNNYKIYKLFKGESEKWYEISTVSGRNIKCSPSHLFMVNDIQKRSDELTENDYLQITDFKQFTTDKIESIKKYEENVTIYNIEVEDAHTYITANNIWQHNKFILDPSNPLN